VSLASGSDPAASAHDGKEKKITEHMRMERHEMRNSFFIFYSISQITAKASLSFVHYFALSYGRRDLGEIEIFPDAVLFS
jgi:hypothetical protein